MLLPKAKSAMCVRSTRWMMISIPADFRLISATNANLPSLVEQNKFREDLFYRIHESSITVPALRDRFEDIPLIAQKVVEQAADEMQMHSPTISPEAMALLRGYSWPGNIRELKNVMRHALAVCDGDIISPSHLPDIKNDVKHVLAPSPEEPLTLADIERDAIKRALLRAGGNKMKASQELDVDYKTLLNKIKRYQPMM